MSASPAPSSSAAATPSAPTRASSPPKARNPLDIRAEEDAARRINVGRALISGEAGGAGNTSDLFGKNALRAQLGSLAREHGVTFDDEALQYLALAAESRLRSLLAETLAVQTHRTCSSHTRPAPVTRSGKAKWDHEAISDPTAILEAMNRQNKEIEQAFRADRMSRIAKETEIQKARDRLAEREREQEEESGAMGEGAGTAAGPSTPAKSMAGSPASGGGSIGTPTFGGVMSDKKKKSAKKTHVTAEVQHKMSNMTAMRSVGFNKKYSWMSSSPAVSSPLAGKKRKKDGETGGGSSLNPNNAKTEPGSPSVKEESGEGGGNDQAGSSARQGQADGTIGAGSDDRPRKKRHRVKLTDPARREVVVSRDGGVERKLPDERVVTMQDVLFVLEKDGVARGMGFGDDLVRRVWALGGMGAKGSTGSTGSTVV